MTSAKFERPAAEDAKELIPSLEKSVADAKAFLQDLDDARALATWKMMAYQRSCKNDH